MSKIHPVYRPHTCHMHATCVLHTCHIHVTCMPHTCHMHATYMSHACHIHATCLSHTCHIYATCMPHACQVHATCMLSCCMLPTYMPHGAVHYERTCHTQVWVLPIDSRSCPKLQPRLGCSLDIAADVELPGASKVFHCLGRCVLLYAVVRSWTLCEARIVQESCSAEHS